VRGELWLGGTSRDRTGGCRWGGSPLLREKPAHQPERSEGHSPAPRPVKKQPQERQRSAAVFGGTRDRLPPARGAVPLALGIEARQGRNRPLGGFGSREPGLSLAFRVTGTRQNTAAVNHTLLLPCCSAGASFVCNE
jgi:hypothetical protein